jgi:hypothetical protein
MQRLSVSVIGAIFDQAAPVWPDITVPTDPNVLITGDLYPSVFQDPTDATQFTADFNTTITLNSSGQRKLHGGVGLPAIAWVMSLNTFDFVTTARTPAQWSSAQGSARVLWATPAVPA